MQNGAPVRYVAVTVETSTSTPNMMSLAGKGGVLLRQNRPDDARNAILERCLCFQNAEDAAVFMAELGQALHVTTASQAP